MKNRDEYVAKLKSQLDQWNADLGRWEAQAKTAKQDLKERSQKELEILKAQRELAKYNLKLLEGASATAWAELRKGADDAWERIQVALANARTHFEKK